MTANDTRINTPPVRGRVTKPSTRKVPSLQKVRALLKQCLKKNDFKMVEGVAMYFKNGLLLKEHRCMRLLAECFEKMGQEENAKRCLIHARAKIQDPMDTDYAHDKVAPKSPRVQKIGQTSPLTPPRAEPFVLGEADMDVDPKEEEQEQEEEEEPLDPADYATKLDDMIRQPELTEEVLLSRSRSPSYERCENQSHTKMIMKLRLPLAPSHWNKEFGDYVTATGIARMTRKDVQGGDRAFRNARNRAAKQAIDKLADMCKRVEDEAKQKLQISLDSWFNTLRRDEYVDKCYQAFKHARDIIFSSAHDGLYSAKVFLYGSATTGLVLGDSDIDVAVALPLPQSRDNPRYIHAEILGFLQRAVEKTMGDVELIPKAKVPVLRYYDPDAKIDVDVTIANDKSVLLSRLLRQHLKGDVRVWELCMAVKFWARRRRISGVPLGHINPMGWIIMAIYFLQHHAVPRVGALYKTKGSDPAQAVIQQVPWHASKTHCNSTAQTGELLLQFFRFFGYNFDFTNEAISINMQYPRPIHALTGKDHKEVIFIEQPFDFGVNVVDYVRATTMDVVTTELRRGYEICKTSGMKNTLFAVREKNEEDRIFNR